MGSETDALIVAGAIADGSSIDWDRLTTGMFSSELHRLVQLRVIDMIARANGHPSNESNPDAGPKAPPVATAATPPARESHLGQWGELLLIEEIGEGSFGTVYRAHDPKLDRPVAVKLLQRRSSTDDQLASRMLHEGRTMARVVHPNVVTVFGAGEYGGRVGLWMEFVRGLTLAQMVRSHGPFGAGEAGLVGYELAGALAAVHLAGLVHRDVKAANVMREEGGRLVLMDFGAGQDRAEERLVVPRIVGTPLYLAPEVLRGGEATERSDIYSLGVLLYHLVTNSFPLKGATFDELVRAHKRREIVPLQEKHPGLPRTFVRVVERALNRDPAKRFASAGRMQAALARIHGSSLVKVSAPRLRTSSRRTSRTGQRSRRPAGVPSIAVLPFTDMSPAKDQEYFCDGLTEELISALAEIPGLRVAARTSAFAFKGQARDIRGIGDALNVATILDGSVRKDGDRLRVTVELICSVDGYHLWCRCFDRDLVDVFAVQEEIARSVVSTLKGKLAADRGTAVIASRSRDLDAYGFYLEGRYHWNKRTEDALKRSVACFERAISQDAGYVEAYTGVADAYVTLGTYGAMPPSEVMPRAKGALEKALEIDAASAEAHACRGCVLAVYDWSWPEAERDFRRAIELKPSYPTAHHWYAINHLVPTGRFDEATEELRCALALDPLALAIKTSLGINAYFAGQRDNAVRELTKTIELDEHFGMARFFLGATYTEQSRYTEALAEFEAAIRLSGRTPEILAALGYLYGLSGNTDGARRVLDELIQLARVRYVSPARIAQVHVGLEERSEALDRLEQAHSERAADLAWVGVRPVFASLRPEPRFVALQTKLGLAVSSLN
jgi:serine/threonine protein kinase/tetratricopeptide (TPR) repeat protein